MTVKTALSILLDGFVVLTTIAAIGTIAALLPYANVHWRITYLSCGGVAIVGITAVVYQMKKLYRVDKVRVLITDLLGEGHKLLLTATAQNQARRLEDFPDRTVRDQNDYNIMAGWCRRVETVLRQHLGESYVTRFHLGGSNQQNATSMTIWKMNHRLETLASFLMELKSQLV